MTTTEQPMTSSKAPEPAESEGRRYAREVSVRLLTAALRLDKAEIPEGEVEKAVDEHLAAAGLRVVTEPETGMVFYQLAEGSP
jgi:hypothetical protein